MPTTTRLSLPYPLSSAVADVPADLAALANAIDANPVGVLFAPGDLIFSAALTRTGALACDGASYLRATYPDLVTAIIVSKGTVTVTIASPGVFSKATHGLSVGDPVYFTTSGALPTGLTANTQYYVATVPTAGTFTVGTGRTLNVNGIPTVTGTVATTGSQSGTHTLFYTPYGIADSTHFNVPDMRGRATIGTGTGSGLSARALGAVIGEESHLLLAAEAAQKDVDSLGASNQHTHAIDCATATGGSAGNYTLPTNTTSSGGFTHTGPDEVDHHHHISGANASSGHNTMPPSIPVNVFIKT